MPPTVFINICPLFVVCQSTLKFGFKTLADTSSSSLFPSNSIVLKRLLLAYQHYILKVYFSDFHLTYTELSHHPTQSCFMHLVPPSALLLEATWGSNGFRCPGSSQSSSLAKEWQSLKNESPDPSLPSSLTHCLIIISIEQLNNEPSLENNKEQARSTLNTINS